MLFKQWLSKDLKEILNQWVSYINKLDLNTKEKYRWIALQIETESEHANQEHSEAELRKVIDWLNREVYKKLVLSLKKEMNQGNNEAFIKYTHLINKAKKVGIK